MIPAPKFEGVWILLRRNGLQGLALVFLVLTLFLEMRLAFWVALGIPCSILGAGAALALGDQTLNMLSLFSFLVALGIVVDDAIVIGENIYAHRQMGKSLQEAAVDGTLEVFPSVTASIMTTVIAFAPMFFVSGVMGKFMAVIPFAVIAMLVISLWESIFVLPSHLAHNHSGFFKLLEIIAYPLRPLGLTLAFLGSSVRGRFELRLQRSLRPGAPIQPSLSSDSDRGLASVDGSRYIWNDPWRHRAVDFVPEVGQQLLAGCHRLSRWDTGCRNGSSDAPNGRGAAKRSVCESQRSGQRRRTKMWPRSIPGSSESVIAGPVRLTYREVGDATNAQNPTGGGSSGSHVGQIFGELHDTEIRNIHSSKLLAMWREEAGEFAGAESVTYGSLGVGPGGKPIEFKLLGPGRRRGATARGDRRSERKTCRIRWCLRHRRRQHARESGSFSFASKTRRWRRESRRWTWATLFATPTSVPKRCDFSVAAMKSS